MGNNSETLHRHKPSPHRLNATALRTTALGTGAHAAAVLSAAATLLAVALTLSTPAANRALEAGPTPVVGLLAAGVGALIAARDPRNPVAWLLIASGVTSALYSLATAATALGLLSSPGAAWLPWGGWLSTVGWVPGAMLGLVLLPQLFPAGVLLQGRGWLVWWWRSLGLAAALLVSLAFTPAAPLFPGLANPLLTNGNGLHRETVEALAGPWGAVLTVLFAVLSVGSVVNIVQRFRRSTPVDRRKTALVLAAWLVLIVASALGNGWLGGAAAALYLLSILISVARYGLYDIDTLISRGTAGAVVLAVLGASYVVTAAGVGMLLGRPGSSDGPGPSGVLWIAGLAGTGVVLILLEPVRRLATRWVNRVFARGRPEAAVLAEQISAEAGAAGTPRAAVEATTALLRERLHMPGLNLVIMQPPLVPPLKDAVEPEAGQGERLPLSWNGQIVGAVEMTPRRGSVKVDPRDVALVVRLEPTLALVVRDVLLTRDLELSKRAVVKAREEERRRIRRDLHDGLGPLLAGAAMTMKAAQGQLAATGQSTAQRAGQEVGHETGTRLPEPPRQAHQSVQHMLGQASEDLGQAVDDIRSLVDGLRPASLDDLGLVAAIHATLPDSTLHLSVTTRGEVQELPAAVEVAALRIVQEALTNVVRHACASTATVVLVRAQGELRITVDDDGTWVPPSYDHRGVGLASVRERAEELGGRADAGPRGGVGNTGGSRVRVWLPLTAEEL